MIFQCMTGSNPADTYRFGFYNGKVFFLARLREHFFQKFNKINLKQFLSFKAEIYMNLNICFQHA